MYDNCYSDIWTKPNTNYLVQTPQIHPWSQGSITLQDQYQKDNFTAETIIKHIKQTDYKLKTHYNSQFHNEIQKHRNSKYIPSL